MIKLSKLRELDDEFTGVSFDVNYDGTICGYYKGELFSFDQTEKGLDKVLTELKNKPEKPKEVPIYESIDNLRKYNFTEEEVTFIHNLYEECEIIANGKKEAYFKELGYQKELNTDKLEAIYNSESVAEILRGLGKYLPYLNITSGLEVMAVYQNVYGDGYDYGKRHVEIFRFDHFEKDITEANKYIEYIYESCEDSVQETFNKRLKKHYPNLPILTKGYLNTYVRVK